MPTWNPALWNPVDDDGPWTVGTPYQRPDWGGWFWFRTLNGNKIVEIMGILIPPAPILVNQTDWFAILPIAFPAMRTQVILGWNSLVWSPGNLRVMPDGGCWLTASNGIYEARIEAFVPIG